MVNWEDTSGLSEMDLIQFDDVISSSFTPHGWFDFKDKIPKKRGDYDGPKLCNHSN